MLAKRSVLIVFIVSLVTACSRPVGTQTSPVQPAPSPSDSTVSYFPLKKGAYWVYRGIVRWTKPDSADVVEEEITWKMEVKEAIRRNEGIGYEMLGAPWDLAWYEVGRQPSKYGIVHIGNRFYRIQLESLTRLSNEQDNLADLVDDQDIFLDTPLAPAIKFCEPDSLSRPDNMYCWRVGEVQPFDASSINGVDLPRELWEFPITKQTMPDISTMYFVPGVGISGYMYRHHGTISEVDVRLVEYSPGE